MRLSSVGHRRFACLLLAFSMLWALSGCGSGAPAPEFPPAEEMVQAAAENFGWTLDPEGTQSWAENHILYALETEDQVKVSASCALADGKRILIETCTAMSLPDKPQFAWEDWKDAVTLVETLYGGFSEGELYEALSGQSLPEPEIPPAGPSTPTGQESLSWEVELPAGYGTVRWSICGGTVVHTFPSPVVKDWRTLFTVSLYASKKDYESRDAASQAS